MNRGQGTAPSLTFWGRFGFDRVVVGPGCVQGDGLTSLEQRTNLTVANNNFNFEVAQAA